MLYQYYTLVSVCQYHRRLGRISDIQVTLSILPILLAMVENEDALPVIEGFQSLFVKRALIISIILMKSGSERVGKDDNFE